MFITSAIGVLVTYVIILGLPFLFLALLVVVLRLTTREQPETRQRGFEVLSENEHDTPAAPETRGNSPKDATP